jgi:hypothetical protein
MSPLNTWKGKLEVANKSNSSVRFLGESTARQSSFRFYLTFNDLLYGPQDFFELNCENTLRVHGENSKYRTRAIITRGLYTFYPLFEVHLCTVTFGLMYG